MARSFGKILDFINAAGERYGGGAARDIIRAPKLLEFLKPLAPGSVDRRIDDISAASERAAQRTFGEDTGITQQNAAARAGATTGSVVKGAADVASLVAPTSAAEGAVKGLSAVQKLEEAGQAGKTGAKILTFLGGSLAGSTAQSVQSVGKGEDVNLGKNAAIGIGVDLATHGAGKLLGKGFEAIKGALGKDVISELAKTADEGAAKKILQKALPGLDDETASAAAQAAAAETDKAKIPDTVTNTVAETVGKQSDVATQAAATAEPVPSVAEPAANAAAAGPQTPEQKIIDALHGKQAALGQSPEKGAISIRAAQEKGYTLERGKRIGASSAAGENLPGSAGYYAELDKLKGALSKQEYGGLSKQLTPDEGEQLFTELRDKVRANPDYAGNFNGVTAQTALRKVIFGGQGVPTNSEIKTLENLFGGDFTKSITDDISTSRTPLQTAKQAAADIAGVPRAIMASADFSGGLRQGLAAATRHPVEFGKAFVNQFKYAGSENAYKALQDEIVSHPNYDLMRKAGLAISAVDEAAGKGEEQFTSNLAEKIPGLGRVVKASDRAYSGLLTSMRTNIFNQLVDNAQRAGIDFSSGESTKLLKDLGEVVNTSTGRGSLGKLEESAGNLSTALFAPRLIASRLQMLNPQYYIKLDPIARREALTTLMSLAGVTGGVLGAAKLAGADVGTEPTSADFGKIKIGDTRLDIMGGYQQYLRLGAQLLEGKTTSSLSGVQQDLSGDYGKSSRLDIINRFLQNKESPVLSFATSLLKGKTATGNPVDLTNKDPLKNDIAQNFIPLVAQDIADLFTHEKAANPAVGPLAAFGVGLQTYGSEDQALGQKQQGYVDKLQEQGAAPDKVKAVNRFYQLSKIANAQRGKANEDINKALDTQDYSRAQQIAASYNDKVKAAFKPWANKYDAYADNPTIVEDYNALKINLNRTSLSQRVYNKRRLAMRERSLLTQ